MLDIEHDRSTDISLVQVGHALRHERRFIFRVALIALLSSILAAFLLPVTFTAEAVILTPQQAQPSLSAMTQMAGGVGSLAGLSLLSGLGLRNPSDLYVGILESRTIADALVRRYDLKHVYGVDFQVKARKKLAERTVIRAGKDNLIHIQVEDREAKRAADLANAYVDELAQRNKHVALTEASERRLFFETEVKEEKDLLSAAEISLRDTQQKTGLVVPAGQAEALLRSASQLHAEILTRQAQLAALRTYVADENPNYQAVKSQLGALQSELKAIESDKRLDSTPELPVGTLPQAGLEYLRKYRDVKYHEALYETLAKEYEAARLDEAKAAPLIQIIDSAVTPERRSWPPRLLIVAISTTLAMLAAGFWAIRRAGH